MADTVAPMITDSVTSSAIEGLGDVSQVATTHVMQAVSVALATMAHNAAATQQAGATLLQAVTAVSVKLLGPSE